MYEEISHSLLNEILKEISDEIQGNDLEHFYIRLGANFYTIHNLFHTLYGERDDFKEKITSLVYVLAKRFVERRQDLKEIDMLREKNYNWFLSKRLVGMALYAKGFNKTLQGINDKISYFEDLGINLIHIMPILKCPPKKSDGGYAVSDFHQIDPSVGTMEDLEELSRKLQSRNIYLVLDVVVNHTSNEHDWARRAKKGERQYEDYYFCFKDREIPDRFEEGMPEVFPESSPGNFTWDPDMEKWVMTVFHDYQWDLNYTNPNVFIEMIDVILFWANQGVDVIRLDAVAFLWKKIGTTCQNEREAHLILQMMKDCCQVTAPGTLFIAEAIVAPSEISKYFGEDAIFAKECEIAYNATLMALLWDAIATKNSKLLYEGVLNLPDKLDRATWLNYVRCHDDIGLGFEDRDIISAGYEPMKHRKFLIDYYTGNYDDSIARGMPFARNLKTGDARISGSLSSLAGLEVALKENDSDLIDNAVKRILLLHSIILSFGGIPLIYYGDELGCTNDYSQLEGTSEEKQDSRWIHRPIIDWEKAERRHRKGTTEHALFYQLKHMISIRKELEAFSDFNNRILIETGNKHLLAYVRSRIMTPSDHIFVVVNFDSKPQTMGLDVMIKCGFENPTFFHDAISGRRPEIEEEKMIIPPYSFYWIRSISI